MTNTCKNCGKVVIPDPDDGHCPECGALDGYTVSSHVTFKWKIEDERDEIKRTIDRTFKKYDEFIKQGKNVEFYKKLKASLEKQTPEFLEQAEKYAKERLELEEKSKKEISFTTDVIVGTHEQANEHIAKLELENNRLKSQLEARILLDEKIERITTDVNDILSNTSHSKRNLIVGVVIGICGSLIASFVYNFLIIPKPTT